MDSTPKKFKNYYSFIYQKILPILLKEKALASRDILRYHFQQVPHAPSSIILNRFRKRPLAQEEQLASLQIQTPGNLQSPRSI